MASGERLASRVDAAVPKMLGTKKDGRPGREVGGRLHYLIRRGEASGNELVDTLRVQRGAALDRLDGLTRELHEGLGQTRALRDEAVELRTSELGLQLDELGRRLRLGESANRVSGLLDAFTAGLDDVLADRASTFDGDLAGIDERFDVRLADFGQLFDRLLRALRATS